MFLANMKENKVKFAFFLFSLMALFLAGSVNLSFGQQKERVNVEFLLSPVGTGSYSIGFAYSEVVNKHHPWFRLSPVETPGGVYLIRTVGERTDVFGVAGAMEAGAKMGTITPEDFRPDEKVAAVVKLKPLLRNLTGLVNYGLAIGIFATLDPNIKTPKDLIGKKIALGKITQSYWAFMPYVFLRNGWEIADKVDIRYISVNGAVDALLDGLVDAAFVCVNAGVDADGKATNILLNEALMRLVASGRKVHFIPITKEEVERMNKFSGWNLPDAVIPAGSVPFLDQDTYGVANTYGYGCHKGMSEEWAYEFTKNFVKYQKEIGAAHAIGKLATPETYNYGYLERQLHPGAVRAYRELGIPIRSDN